MSEETRPNGPPGMSWLIEILLQSNRHCIHSSCRWDRFQRGEGHLGQCLQQANQRHTVFWRRVGSLPEILNGYAVTVSDFEDEPVEGLAGAKGELIVQWLISHILAQHSCVSSQSGNGHADIVFHFKDLVLVAGKFWRQLFEAAQHYELSGAEAKANGALLDCLHCVFHLEQLALWRPCGAIEVVQSLQHWF